MKKMRRIVGLLLAMVMVFGMTATALAATVDNQTDHSYAAYQVFKGTQQESVKEGDDTLTALGDVDWGDGVDGDALLNELKTLQIDGETPFADCTTAADVAGVLDGEEDYTSAKAKAFANAAAKHTAGSGTEIPAESNSVDLADGYYLLVDTEELGENDAYNSALLQITNQTITIKKKYDVPTVDKSVKADTDTDGEAGESADVSIGDTVTFTLKGTLPENYDDYEKYKYEFTDTLSKGLEYQSSPVSVKLYADNAAFEADKDRTGGTDLTCTPVEGTGADGATTLTWTFDDLKALTDVTITKDSVIAVTYTAELTSDAAVGSAGNPNTVTLTYTNDPNYTGTGDPTTSTTPEDKVLVFTYEIDGTKVDSQDETKKLADAQFILYRGIDGAEPGADDADGNPTGVEYALVSDGRLTDWTTNRAEAMAETNLLKSAADTGEFKLAGLDAGTYYLEETKAPAGYNLLKEPIKMVVTAELDKTEDNPALTKLTIKVDEEQEKDGDTTSGAVSLNVENSSGVLLPSTGGMGTTLFYVVGAALILAAGALLVMKRRTGEGK